MGLGVSHVIFLNHIWFTDISLKINNLGAIITNNHSKVNKLLTDFCRQNVDILSRKRVTELITPINVNVSIGVDEAGTGLPKTVGLQNFATLDVVVG